MRIRLSNFKCFDQLQLDISPLSVFAGYNGGGKSTAIQIFLLISQSLRVAPFGQSIDLNGSLVHLGNAIDVVGAGSDSPIEFEISDAETTAHWTLLATRRSRHFQVLTATFTSAGETYEGQTVAPPPDHVAWNLCARIRDLTFLGTTRHFSTSAWPSPPMSTPASDVGKSGEFAPYWHFNLGDDDVPRVRRHPSDERGNVRGQIDAFMSELFPEAQAVTDQLKDVDLFRLDLRLGKGQFAQPANIGFGLTYAFPLIVTLVTSSPGRLVIVDSPEAHLHPRAQSALGRILAHFVTAGLRILVETHSDHLLNGIRLAVKEASIAPKDVGILFFGGASSATNGVKSISVDSEGAVDFWPEGFFDQAERDLALLAGIS